MEASRSRAGAGVHRWTYTDVPLTMLTGVNCWIYIDVTLTMLTGVHCWTYTDITLPMLTGVHCWTYTDITLPMLTGVHCWTYTDITLPMLTGVHCWTYTDITLPMLTGVHCWTYRMFIFISQCGCRQVVRFHRFHKFHKFHKFWFTVSHDLKVFHSSVTSIVEWTDLSLHGGGNEQQVPVCLSGLLITFTRQLMVFRLLLVHKLQCAPCCWVSWCDNRSASIHPASWRKTQWRFLYSLQCQPLCQVGCLKCILPHWHQHLKYDTLAD